jgi:hypothetical protein
MTRTISVFSRTPSLLFPSLLVCALFLSGCGAARYRADYNGFNAAYADSSNHQMLLNLARLDQHDPTYFLQFGQISVSYQVSSSLNGGFSNTVPSQATAHIPVFSETGTLAAGASTTPSFTFIPVSDDKVAQQLLLPVPPDVIYTLFQQGAPVDQLLRLMVERFEIQLPGDSKITTYSNSPGRCDVRSYATFLKICAIAREFQLDGHLKLRATEQFVPLADKWASKKQPEAKDLLDAKDKGFTYKQIDGNWELGKNELQPSFILDGESDATFQRLRKNPVYREGTSLENVRALLSGDGFSVQGKLVEQQNTGSHLVMRSFLNILAAAAQEQTNFDVVLGHADIISHIPETELRPILRLKWDGEHADLLPSLVSLDYQGQSYQVTDPVTGKVDESASWNRDVFRLLAELATQVSVDISKFPLPTTLQVVP